MRVTGTLTLLDSKGQIVIAFPFTIPAGGLVVRQTGSSDLNVPRSVTGSALFSHSGPLSDVLGDVFIVNATGSLPVPVKFEPVANR